MANDAGDDTGRLVEHGLERLAANIAMGRVREVARASAGARDGGATKAHADSTTTFLEVPVDDARERDLVVDALRSRGVECEAVDGATGGPCVLIAERDRGQAIDAATDIVISRRRGRAADTEAFDLARECRDMREVALEAGEAELQMAVGLEERSR